MEKNGKIRYMAWLIMILIVSISIISCEKEEPEFDFPIIENGAMALNTTYQLKGIRELDVVLATADTNTISVCGGNHLGTVFGTVSTSPHHIIIDGEFVRFRSSDYDTEHNVERYDEIVKVSNIKN